MNGLVNKSFIQGNLPTYQPAKIPGIAPYFGLKIIILAIGDNIYLTILQKRENRRNDSPLDNIRKQVA
jgi:hypothetical protein